MARRMAAVLALGLAVASPGVVDAGGLELRVGGFFPRAKSDLFADASELYTVGRDDWRGFSGGIEYSFDVSRHVELGFHLHGYGRRLGTSYRNYTFDHGGEIHQRLALDIVPLGASLRFLPAGRRANVSPYVTVGADVFFYRYEAVGDFIDFFSEEGDVLSDAFLSEGAAPGFHVAGGIRVPLGHDWSAVGEVRYQYARTRMEPDFDRNRLDMSGLSTTVGVRLQF